MDGHGQHAGRERPVEGEPGERLDEVAEAVHVRVAGARRLGVLIQVVIEVPRRQHRAADEVQNHQQVSEVPVVGHHLQKHRENGREHEWNPRQDEHAAQVDADLEGVVDARGLDAHAGQYRGDQHCRDDDGERRELGAPQRPVGNGKRIDHLVHPRRSLAPDQLPAVDGDDDEDDDEERALQDVDHQVGHGVDGGAEEAIDRERIADHVQHAEGKDDEEPRAPQHAGDLHAGLVRELAEAGDGQRRMGSEGGQRREDQPGRFRRLGCFRSVHVRRSPAPPPRPAPTAPALADGEREPGIGERERQNRKGQHDEAVGEEIALEGEQHRVALGDRPVAGGDVESAAAERVEHRGEALVLDIGKHAAGDAVRDEHADHAGVGRHQAARQGGQGELDATHEQHVRHDEDRQCLQVRAGPERPDPLRFQPRHQAPEQHAEHDRHEDGESGDERPGEATEHVIALADRCREEQLVRACLPVAEHGIRHERSGGEDTDDAHHQQQSQDDERRVAVDVADRAADDDGVGGNGQERGQEEEGAGQQEDRLPQLVAQLEAEDFGEHSGILVVSSRPRRVYAAAPARLSVEKYTSVSSVRTRSNPSAGRSSA